jgi:hypothetical protein
MHFRAGWQAGFLRDLWIACPPGQASRACLIDEGSTHKDACFQVSIEIAPIWPGAYFYEERNNKLIDAFHLLLDKLL